MTHHTPPTFFALPVDAKRRVDEVCVSFECAGRGARVEDYLPRVDPELRGTLLTELLALELEWRRGDGETPQAVDYLDRFPNDVPAVQAAFGLMLPVVGDRLGKYHLTAILGRGGMGVVFEAEDSIIDRKVAVKVLPAALSPDPLARERLLREAKLAGQLLHPNVVAVFEAGEANGVTYLALERVTGGSASERLKRDGPLDWRLATRIAIDATRGLDAIHDAGFLHLDVKPGNILLPQSGNVLAKLADFSLSTTEAGAPGTGSTAGTPAYMSPEQRDGGELTRRTDVFGLGAAYFALLTGRAPFPGASVTEVIAEQFREPAPDPRAVNPAVPAAVARVVLRAMSPDPARRYPTADAMRADLEKLLAPPQQSHRGQLLAAAGAAALVLAGVAGFWQRLLPPLQQIDEVDKPLPVVRIESPLEEVDAWQPLLDDRDLGGWKPVVAEGATPIGKGPRSEFSLVRVEGQRALRSTGTGQGGVESEREYDNFHLRFEYRWAQAEGDHFASVRYHCGGTVGSRGTHGMQLNTLRPGGYLRLNDLLRIDEGEIRGAAVFPVRPGGQRIDPTANKEEPVGRWNKAALVCVGDWSVHVINGVPVLALARSRRADPADEPLTRGRIRFQSVKGEIFFRKIEIRRATELPAEYRPPNGG